MPEGLNWHVVVHSSNLSRRWWHLIGTVGPINGGCHNGQDHCSILRNECTRNDSGVLVMWLSLGTRCRSSSFDIKHLECESRLDSSDMQCHRNQPKVYCKSEPHECDCLIAMTTDTLILTGAMDRFILRTGMAVCR